MSFLPSLLSPRFWLVRIVSIPILQNIFLLLAQLDSAFNINKMWHADRRLYLPVTLCLSASVNEMFMCLRAQQRKHKWAIISVYMCALVSNIAGRLSSTNTESLLPTFSYLYCFLSLSSADSTDRGKRLFFSSSLTLHLHWPWKVCYTKKRQE